MPHAARRTLLLLLLAGLSLPGCAYYSFTGASIPEHLASVAVPLAIDETSSPLTTLDETLTRLLVDRFVGQTRLRLETDEAEADAVLLAAIERYANEPAAVSGDEQAEINRVTLTVRVRYLDQVEERTALERTFTGFGEYDPVAEGLAGEQAAAGLALERIADDIFSAATSNW